MRALYAAGQDFEPLASGARAFYAVGHLFEPLASGVRALYASWHSFEQLASGVSALYEAGYLFEPLASGVRALYAAGHFFLNQLLPEPALAVLNSSAGYREPRHGAFLRGAAGSELNESPSPGRRQPVYFLSNTFPYRQSTCAGVETLKDRYLLWLVTSSLTT